MAEGVLYDVASGIVGKAGNLALKEIVLIWSVKDEITKLGETVSIIKAFKKQGLIFWSICYSIPNHTDHRSQIILVLLLPSSS